MPEQGTQEQPKPFEYKLNDGSVIKAASLEEAVATAVKMKEDTAAELKRTRDQTTALQNQIAQLQQQVVQKPAPTNGDHFNKDEYFRLLNEDPVSAQNYLDGYRFGVPAEQVVPQFVGMSQGLSKLQQEAIAGQFLTQHYEDFPANAENAKLLTDRVAKLVEEQGFMNSVDTLNFAYSQLVEEGSIKPLEAAPTAEQQQSQSPNPTLRGGGGEQQQVSQDDYQKILNGTEEEARAIMRQKGFQV